MVSGPNLTPALTPEQVAALRDAARPLAAARDTFQRLHAMGFDMSSDLDQVDRVEAMRKGLLDQFSAQRPANGRSGASRQR